MGVFCSKQHYEPDTSQLFPFPQDDACKSVQPPSNMAPDFPRVIDVISLPGSTQPTRRWGVGLGNSCKTASDKSHSLSNLGWGCAAKCLGTWPCSRLKRQTVLPCSRQNYEFLFQNVRRSLPSKRTIACLRKGQGRYSTGMASFFGGEGGGWTLRIARVGPSWNQHPLTGSRNVVPRPQKRPERRRPFAFFSFQLRVYSHIFSR